MAYKVAYKLPSKPKTSAPCGRSADSPSASR
nr:MAG TPA: hypothetical protein [Caudoviricetes sp.]